MRLEFASGATSAMTLQTRAASAGSARHIDVEDLRIVHLLGSHHLLELLHGVAVAERVAHLAHDAVAADDIDIGGDQAGGGGQLGLRALLDLLGARRVVDL